MSDLINAQPTAVTVGSSSDATLLTADLGLPAGFAIVQPGRRGYLLTLGDRMSGTIKVEGVEHDVRSFVHAGDDGSGFRAIAIGGDDWGVVELDETGDVKLFFQFVPVEPIAPRGAISWLLASDGESRASLAFSVVMHLALLLFAFQLADRAAPFTWPTAPSIVGSTDVVHPDELEPVLVKTTLAAAPSESAPGAATAIAEPRSPMPRAKPMPSTVWHPVRVKPTLAPPARRLGGVLDHRDVIDQVRAGGSPDAIARLQQLGGGQRPGGEIGGEIGGGPNTRGGGRDGEGNGPVGTRTGTGDLDTGGLRAGVCVGAACDGNGGAEVVVTPPASIDLTELTKDDIDRVMKARAGMFRACYQKELDRSGPSGGRLLARFEINAGGKVTAARIIGGSLASGAVRSCVTRVLTILRFPAKGGGIVNYPFIFSMGG